MNISIDRYAPYEPDGVIREMYTYSFYIYADRNQLAIILNMYLVMRRRSKRHGWNLVDKWSRLMQRDSTIDRPDVPSAVKEEVVKAIEKGMVFQ